MDRPSFRQALAQIGDQGLPCLSALLESASFGVYIDEPTLGCIYANDTLLGLFDMDWESFQGYGWAKAIVAEDVERVQNTISGFLRSSEPTVLTYRIQPANSADVRWVRVDAQAALNSEGDRIGTVCFAEDVTERTTRSSKQIEEQKMEAVGQLAARLAHDLNNLLTAIIGNTELLGLEISSDAGRARLDNIEVVFEQARNLTNQLLTLSKKDVYQSTTSVLDTELDRLSRILKSTVGGGVELSTSYGASNCQVALSFSQLGQIMLNLSSNARDAMEGRGQLSITSSVKDGKIHLVVQDNGCGMTQETLHHACTPFFTTKEQGRGSGLGLATVRSLVELINGKLHLESIPGEGTTGSAPTCCKKYE